jgi:hypothetical protein
MNVCLVSGVTTSNNSKHGGCYRGRVVLKGAYLNRAPPFIRRFGCNRQVVTHHKNISGENRVDDCVNGGFFQQHLRCPQVEDGCIVPAFKPVSLVGCVLEYTAHCPKRRSARMRGPAGRLIAARQRPGPSCLPPDPMVPLVTARGGPETKTQMVRGELELGQFHGAPILKTPARRKDPAPAGAV